MDACVLVNALSQPHTYPDRPTQVSLRQTHISWLFFSVLIDASFQRVRHRTLTREVALQTGPEVSVDEVVARLGLQTPVNEGEVPPRRLRGVFVVHEPLQALQLRLEAQARARLEKFIQEHLPGDGTPEVCLATGAPAAQILHTAHLIQADVILLGTHTEGKPEARLLGDTVARVVREALCPVTIVPPTWACVERAQDQGAEAG